MYHLAQINIGLCKGPLDSPVMREFVELLDAMNALADASPGFVWRLQTPDGNATGVRAHPNPLVITNVSMWTGVEALHHYTYRSSHAYAFRHRGKWFDELEGPHLALWWIEVGGEPSAEEGLRRIDLLARRGPSPDAFTFKQPFPPPGP